MGFCWFFYSTGRPVRPSVRRAQQQPQRQRRTHSSHSPCRERIMTTLLFAHLVRQSANSGLDLLHPFHTKWYNDLIESEGLVESGALRPLPEPPCVVAIASNPSGLENNGEASSDDEEHRDDSPKNDDWWLKDHLGNNCNAILIGNTKNVWPRFVQWLKVAVEGKMKDTSSLNDEGDCTIGKSKREALEELVNIGPFDTFLEESLCRILGEIFGNEDRESCSLKSYEIFWSNGKRRKVDLSHPHPRKPPDFTPSTRQHGNYHCFVDHTEEDDTTSSSSSSFLVSMQRVAQITGLYWHDAEATKLCIHPDYGTWIAFRAVVIFEWDRRIHDDETRRRPHDVSSTVSMEPPPPPAPSPCPCPLSSMEMQTAKAMFDRALQKSCSSAGENDRDGGGDGYGSQANKSWS